MNTSRSREFTNKETAKVISKRRGKEIYLLGTNKRGTNVYFVGDYKSAMKAKGKYKN